MARSLQCLVWPTVWAIALPPLANIALGLSWTCVCAYMAGSLTTALAAAVAFCSRQSARPRESRDRLRQAMSSVRQPDARQPASSPPAETYAIHERLPSPAPGGANWLGRHRRSA